MEIKFIEQNKKICPNIVVVLDNKLSLSSQLSKIKKQTGVDLGKIIKLHTYKAKEGEILFIPTENQKLKNIVLFGIGDATKAKMPDLIRIGSKLYKNLTAHSIKETEVYFSLTEQAKDKENKILDFLLGMFLGSYRFDKYKTVKKDEDKNKKIRLEKVNVIENQASKMNKELSERKTFSDSVALVKDLIAEPANVINPSTLSKICAYLKKHGIKVEILDEKKIKKLGMNALLGVAQGSTIPPHVVVMHWEGDKKSKKKVALIGKGVTFDSGGLSLKPPSFMKNMKGDMAGAAIVIGMLKMLASRKAKANVIGVVGLVENMPSGGAQKPGDIVKSMSGQTIEVLNTDAEGRLVLADVLWYTQKMYKPTVMIDFATLTGAVIISLADKMAGLFSNNDDLAKQLLDAGKETGERCWQMPLDKEYDKMIDSKIADMMNIGKPDGYGGSIIAGQFLQRFVNNVNWAHIDIAGVSERSKVPTAFGMRLLNKFIKDNYER